MEGRGSGEGVETRRRGNCGVFETTRNFLIADLRKSRTFTARENKSNDKNNPYRLSLGMLCNEINFVSFLKIIKGFQLFSTRSNFVIRPD